MEELEELTRELEILSSKLAREDPITSASFMQLIQLSQRIGKTLGGNIEGMSRRELNEIRQLTEEWIALLKEVRESMVQ